MESSSKIRRAFFGLLRAGLWNKPIEDASHYNLSGLEWKIVWKEAVQQSVRGLVYEGACLLPEECMPPDRLMIRWTAEIDRIERRNASMNQALSAFLRQVRQLDVEPVVMKGQGVAQFYENPLLRECGDIDLYFHSSAEETRVLDYLKRTGVPIRLEPDGSYEYVFQAVEMEHHTHLIDLYAPAIQTYLAHWEKQYGSVELSLGDDSEGTITVPSPLLNLLLLNTHILKHSMGHGIGLRQFCDLARAYHQLNHAYNGEELKTCLAQCGISRWSRLLHSFLVNELHLPVEALPYEEELLDDTSCLLNKVMKAGNFGMYSGSRKGLTSSVWNRKWNTAFSFVRNLPFSLKYAPHEAVALVRRLCLGNLKS